MKQNSNSADIPPQLSAIQAKIKIHARRQKQYTMNMALTLVNPGGKLLKCDQQAGFGFIDLHLCLKAVAMCPRGGYMKPPAGDGSGLFAFFLL